MISSLKKQADNRSVIHIWPMANRKLQYVRLELDEQQANAPQKVVEEASELSDLV
jgi:hypothetical protein